MNEDKKQKYIIDFMRVTVKPDIKAAVPCMFTLEAVLGSLGLLVVWDNFVDIGARNNYTHTFCYNNIIVYTTDYAIMSEEERKTATPEQIKHFVNMGVHISMSGQGCRYYESLQKDTFHWKEFCQILQAWQNSGCKLNYSRTDYAMDDYCGLLNMPIIIDCVKERKYVSLFRSRKTQESCLPYDIQSSFKGDKEACTVYLGNKKSNTFVRFYDKRMEQLFKCKPNTDEYNRLLAMPHWVRCEFVFKNLSANKLVAALLEMDEKQFSDYFAQVVNEYIRFTEESSGKSTRRTICKWWSDFLGTVKCAKLVTVPDYISYFRRACNFIKNISPSLYSVKKRIGDDMFLGLINDAINDGRRLKQRHFEIMHGDISCDTAMCDVDFWKFLKPMAGAYDC